MMNMNTKPNQTQQVEQNLPPPSASPAPVFSLFSFHQFILSQQLNHSTIHTPFQYTHQSSTIPTTTSSPVSLSHFLSTTQCSKRVDSKDGRYYQLFFFYSKYAALPLNSYTMPPPYNTETPSYPVTSGEAIHNSYPTLPMHNLIPTHQPN